MIRIKIELPNGVSMIDFDGTNVVFETDRYNVSDLEECFAYIIRTMKCNIALNLAKH